MASVARRLRRLNGAHRLYKAKSNHATIYTTASNPAQYINVVQSQTQNAIYCDWNGNTWTVPFNAITSAATNTAYTNVIAWQQTTNTATGTNYLMEAGNQAWNAWYVRDEDTQRLVNQMQAAYQVPREAPHFNRWLDGVWERKDARARTEAEREEAVRLAKEREVAHFRAIKEREAADKRAVELLRNALTEEQRKEYDTLKYFHVTTKHGRKYKIGSSGVVTLEHEGKALERWCLHVGSGLPLGDDMLGKKLWIETDELEARRVANITDLTTHTYASKINTLAHLPRELQAA